MATATTQIEDLATCVKLQLPDNIVAYLEGKELLRDDFQVISCDNNVTNRVMTNYILAKQILGNLSWQNKLVCKNVCSTWQSAIKTLNKEQQSPEDFVLDIPKNVTNFEAKYVSSGTFAIEPLVVLTFVNSEGYSTCTRCKHTIPSPCGRHCENTHCLLDFIYHYSTAPNDCMFTVKSNYVSYLPLPRSITHEFAVKPDIFFKPRSFIGGVYIPAIPNVGFQVINITTDSEMPTQFFEDVNKIAETHIFKGVLVYVTDKYILQTVEDIVFLNHFKKVQPDIPYALAGCIVEDATYGLNDIQSIVDEVDKSPEYTTDNLISIGLFTIPKDADKSTTNNFDIFSLIIESKDWTRPKILHTITEFSKKVPHFEHSVVLKLSCVGRNEKHKIEQDYFRNVFPNTRLIGCYGNGELGVNHPTPDPDKSFTTQVKRQKTNLEPDYALMYSYSTVFFYIGWGKILAT